MKTIVIAGTGSGVGKTSITLGLVRALVRQGLKVATFKVGPDYLDPSWLRLASGRDCYNLDGWMTDRSYVEKVFFEQSQACDVAIIEGVMGMFDGASATELTGSTAEIAQWLKAPIFLVCNSHGCARSFAATVSGFHNFEENIHINGVIANHCGSKGHIMIMEQALSSAKLPPLAGFIERNTLPTLPGRHLGLHTANQVADAEATISQLADKIAHGLDLEKMLSLADLSYSYQAREEPQLIDEPKLRLAIARDEAFQFYYPDNLQALEKQGIELVPFSPIHDEVLPTDCHGLYIGGGYPEAYIEQLSKNKSMLEAIREHARSNKFLYAECGGLMYLSRFVRQVDGSEYHMVDLLPFGTEMLQKRKMLGYTTTTLESDCLLGDSGIEIRGHEFHYSQIIEESIDTDWQKIYTIRGRRKNALPRTEGFRKGNVLASYVHQHFASNPKVLQGILKSLKHSKAISD